MKSAAEPARLTALETARPSDQVAAWLARRFPGFAPDPSWQQVHDLYPVLAGEEYLDLIERPSYDDPIFAQVVPSPRELEAGGSEDAVSEQSHSPVPGLLHRYTDRVLVMPTSGCFIRCRHCMRKRLWRASSDRMDDPSLIGAWADYIRSNPHIREVIVSGGDPLTLSDDRLEYLLAKLGEIDTVKHLRIHTRAVVAAPSRITDRLAHMLAGRKVGLLVTQFNHPREVTSRSLDAARKLRQAGVAIQNQSVLLRGINDAPGLLRHLFLLLSEAGIGNRYLHHPDKVRGAMHFHLGPSAGLAIYRRECAGFDTAPVPPYVIDLPESAKTPVEKYFSFFS